MHGTKQKKKKKIERNLEEFTCCKATQNEETNEIRGDYSLDYCWYTKGT